MKTKRNLVGLGVVGVVTIVLFMLVSQTVEAHCDTLDGPVVTTAKAALEKGDVTAVLKWVSEKDEAEIKKAFQQTLSVRKLSPQAKELADRYFFETLVRIHRTGEGASYTGLKPAGSVEPSIAAADKALESGSVDNVVKEITQTISTSIRQRFNEAMEAKKQENASVQKGREYVKAYIEFIHYVEKLHLAATDAIETSEETETAHIH